MTRWIMAALLAVVAAAGVEPAEAQTGILPVAVGVRGGAAIPVGDLASEEAIETGWGFEVNGQLRVFPGVAVYVAFDRFKFPIRAGAASTEGTLTERGFSLGGMLSVPIPLLGISPWVRGGAIYNSARYDGATGSAERESDPGLGYEVGGGVTLPLGLVVAFTPAVRYRSYSPGFDTGAGSDVDHSYMVADLGLTFRF